jgi:hypothetical protein
MNKTEFIAAIEIVAVRNVVKAVSEALRRPTARPSPEALELSKWYSDLPSEAQEMTNRIIRMAATQATYNFLLVLDGLLAIEPQGPKGKLELYFIKADERLHLNDENSEPLTSLFKP